MATLLKSIFSFKKSKKTDNELYLEFSGLDTKTLELYTRGLQFYYENDFETALPFFNSSINKGMKNDKAFFCRGLCYQNLNMHAEAINDFTKAISINPDYYQQYCSRAISYRSTGDLEGELNDVEKAEQLLSNQEKLSSKEAHFLTLIRTWSEQNKTTHHYRSEMRKWHLETLAYLDKLVKQKEQGDQTE
jgi:tetratricopeptide (TPR) repeat protein